jgi:hypothetical protein
LGDIFDLATGDVATQAPPSKGQKARLHMLPTFLVDAPVTTPSSLIAAFLKCASLRTKLVAIEIESAAVALAGGFITQDQAVAWATDAGIALSIPLSS